MFGIGGNQFSAKLSNLEKIIHNLYKDEISDAEAAEASSNLLGFFRVLNEIHEEQESIKNKEKLDGAARPEIGNGNNSKAIGGNEVRDGNKLQSN